MSNWLSKLFGALPAPDDLLGESERHRFWREFRRSGAFVLAVVLAVGAAVVLSLFGVPWVLAALTLLLLLHAARSWRTTLLAQRDDARNALASARVAAGRYPERLRLFQVLQPGAVNASRHFNTGPSSLERFNGDLQIVVRALREHGEENSADELDALRRELLALGDEPSAVQFRDAADQAVQYLGRLVGIHSPLFNDTQEIAALSGNAQAEASEALAVLMEENAALRARIEVVTPLEDWLQQRVDAHKAIERQRQVRGDKWYFGALNDWDFATTNEMGLGENPVAPDLVDAYRRDPRTGHVDGTDPEGDVGDSEEYYGRRLDWLTRTLRELRAHDESQDIKRASPLVHDLRWHLHKGEELEGRVESARLAGVLELIPDIETWTQQAHRRLSEQPPLAQRFLDADPGFTSVDPLEQMVRAPQIIAKRVACLEEILQELGGEGGEIGVESARRL